MEGETQAHKALGETISQVLSLTTQTESSDKVELPPNGGAPTNQTDGTMITYTGHTGFDYDGGDSDLLIDEDISQKVYFVDDVESTAFCEPYRGKLCSHLLGHQLIYVTSQSQQDATEKQLASSGALNFFLSSTDNQPHGPVSEECGQSVLFLACVYAFPLCSEQPTSIQISPLDERIPSSHRLANLPAVAGIKSAIRARQLCRVDCNYVNSIACKSFFKDPDKNLLKKLKLPTCDELPPSSNHADCLSLAYLTNAEPKSEHACYNKSGKSYRGLVTHSASGRPCLPWTSVTSKKGLRHLAYISHPELGNHQYCRNPQEDLLHQSPWCFVQKVNHLGNVEVGQETCSIPKCGGWLDSDMWMVVVPSVLIPAGLAFLLMLTYLLCCKRYRSARFKQSGATSSYSECSSAMDKKHLCQYNGNDFRKAFSKAPCTKRKRKNFFNRSNSSGQPITRGDNMSVDYTRQPSSKGHLVSSAGSMGSGQPTHPLSALNLHNLNDHPVSEDPAMSTPLLASYHLTDKQPALITNIGLIDPEMRTEHHSMTAGSSKTSDSNYSICKDILPSQIQFLNQVGEELNDHNLLRMAGSNVDISRRSQYFVRALKDPELLDRFLSECNALSSKPPRHLYLASLVGICQEPPAAFFEYLPFNLHESLLKQRRSHHTGASSVFHVRFCATLAHVLYKVLLALTYMGSRNLIHKDVASRNVLVDNLTNPCNVKLSDFARCRSAYASDYHRIGSSMLPVRWMAPESVLSGAYSHKSDVWSFGVLLWEFCCLGRLPYEDASHTEVIERLRNRELLVLPCNIASLPISVVEQQSLSMLRSMMFECWAANPKSRPTSKDLRDRFTLSDTIGQSTGNRNCALPDNIHSRISSGTTAMDSPLSILENLQFKV